MKYKVLIILFLGIIIYSGIKIRPSFSSNAVLYYNGNTKEFTYFNLDKKDVFDDFKDMMPGDTRSQTLTVRAGNIKPGTKLYLKLHSDINEEVLKYINISVYENDKLLSSNEDMIKLYNFTKDDVFTMKVVVEVPTSVGNEVEELIAHLKWSFMIEEDGNTEEVPRTYDGFNMIKYISMILVSLVMIIILIFKIKDNTLNKEEI